VFFPKILGFIWVTVARYDSHANGAREISHRLYDENTARALQIIQLCTVLRKPEGYHLSIYILYTYILTYIHIDTQPTSVCRRIERIMLQ